MSVTKITLLTLVLLAQSYNIPFSPPTGGCASPAPSSITFWFNGDGGAVSSPTNYTLDSTTEYTIDSDKTGTFGTTAAAVETVAETALGGTNVLQTDLDAGTNTLSYLGFTQTSSNIFGTQYGRIGLEAEFDVDPTGAGSPRLFIYEAAAGAYLRIIHVSTSYIRAVLFTGGSTVTLESANPLLTFDGAGEIIYIEVSWDTVSDTYKLFINGGSPVATSSTAIADYGSDSSESIRIGNNQGSININFQYHISNVVIAKGTAGRDLDIYNIVKTTGITDYNACNFP